MTTFKTAMKTLVQCDFDGTVTQEDVSLALLDAFADGDWKQLFQGYHQGKITVGQFNSEAFAMVKTDRENLIKVVKDTTRLRPWFPELVSCCREKGFRLVIISNGLAFYIEEILQDMGVNGIEVHAATTEFRSEGLKVQYHGPDGAPLDKDVKAAYINSFLKEGYRMVYMGDGLSDIAPARLCHHIFATGDLLSECHRTNLGCLPFNDFHQVTRVLALW
jgi:2-hydroxy-3-keto-5-methylthiopentenyl-1-phosphate phosphatase